jgi:hypothetical protein
MVKYFIGGDTMTIQEIIKKYNIADNGDGTIRISVPRGHKLSDDEANTIKAAKPEILAYFAEQRAAVQERQRRIAAIAGLNELRAAHDAWGEYHYKISKMFDSETGSANPPRKPDVLVAVLEKQYPRATAFLKAEAWENASNYAKSAAGNKAKERIINGEDYVAALADMEAEWSAHCEKHVWD